jgi:arylsulfatase A-like enzyme
MNPLLPRRTFLQTLGGAALALSAETAPPMNVLFILTDDLGWHDTGPYGNAVIDTPNLNRFASESCRFDQAYAACCVCSPTRASIMTGLYPARLKLTDWIPGRKHWPYAKVIPPSFEQQLPATAKTIAEVLHPAGYRSAAIGKWHMGGAGSLPTDRGFDVNIAGNAAGSPPAYFGPLDLPNLKLEPGEFLTQRLTYEGGRFMNAGSGPFFLYQAHFTVHMPLQAPKELVEKYRARQIGDLDPTYCAMVETADQSVGALLKSLDESGKAERTVVVFFSDNGGVRYQGKRVPPVTNNAPLRAGKGHLYEGGIREPLMIRWPGVTRPGSVVHTPVCSVDFHPTLSRVAGVSRNGLDGVDLEPLLRGASISERPLFWHYPHYSDQGGPPAGAVRLGSWKLMEFFEDGRLELFHLDDDPGERQNLVRKEAGRARKLHRMLLDWRKAVDASMPSPNPGYDPKRASEELTGYEAPTVPV